MIDLAAEYLNLTMSITTMQNCKKENDCDIEKKTACSELLFLFSDIIKDSMLHLLPCQQQMKFFGALFSHLYGIKVLTVIAFALYH